MKILIVDDSHLILDKTKELLTPLPTVTEVSAATSFDEAKDALEKIAPDVAILDIHLKDKNGIELLKYSKENYPEVKVIMFTNESGEEYELKCKKLGADYFISKSDFEELISILSTPLI